MSDPAIRKVSSWLDPAPPAPRTAGRRLGAVLLTWALGLGAGVALVRCGPTVNQGVDPARPVYFDGRQVIALAVKPDNDVLLVDLAAPQTPATRAFAVLGVLADGSSVDLTSRSVLKLERAELGRLDGVTFTAAARTGPEIAFTRVSATYTADGAAQSGFANLTLVWLRQSGPAQDFFFSLPYRTGGEPQAQPLAFSTRYQSLDAFFAVDTTASMAPSIVALRDSLQSLIIPQVKRAAVKDAWFGVGAVEDFPTGKFGRPGCRTGLPDDQPFILLQAMSSDVTRAQVAVGNLLYGAEPRGCGEDWPEGQLEALYQLATGEGNGLGGASIPRYGGSGKGGAGFRDGALPIVTLVTDASFHVGAGDANSVCSWTDTYRGPQTDNTQYASPALQAAHARGATMSALNGICAKVIGVAPQLTGLGAACLPGPDLVATARATGAVVPPVAFGEPGARPPGCAVGQCCTGLGGQGEAPDGSGLCPLVFKVGADGAGMGTQVSAAITQLVRYGSFDVVTSRSGGTQSDAGAPLPAGRTTADFIKDVLAVSATAPPAPPVIAAPRPGTDGRSFTGVVPGSEVRFDVKAQNDLVPETPEPQVFRATIKVRAGGCADLDQRDVIILVPPKAPVAG